MVASVVASALLRVVIDCEVFVAVRHIVLETRSIDHRRFHETIIIDSFSDIDAIGIHDTPSASVLLMDANPQAINDLSGDPPLLDPDVMNLFHGCNNH